MKTSRLAAWAALWVGRVNALGTASGPIGANTQPLDRSGAYAQTNLEAQIQPDRGQEKLLLQLELAEKRAQFWSSATHDLCQPAQALALFLERLKRLPMDPQVTPVVGYLDSSMQDLTRLVTEMLEVAQLDAGSVRVHRAPVGIDGVIERLVAHLAPIAAHKRLRLRWRTRGQWVWTDAALLERILTVLGDNALSYTQRGAVLVTCRNVDQGRAVRIAVYDSGIGMAAKQQEHIFEPFSRASKGQRPRPGLGLYLAQRLAQLLGSSLVVRSTLGRGSCFSVTLPCAAASETSQASLSPDGLNLLTLKGMRIALIGQDQVQRARVADLLESWGCTIWRDNRDGAGAGDLPDGPAVPQAIVCVDAGGGVEGSGFKSVAELFLMHATIPACMAVDDRSTAWATEALEMGFVLLDSPLQAAPLRAFLRRSLKV